MPHKNEQDENLKDIYGKIFEETENNAAQSVEKEIVTDTDIVTEDYISSAADSSVLQESQNTNQNSESKYQQKNKVADFFNRVKKVFLSAYNKTIKFLKHAFKQTKKALIFAWNKTKVFFAFAFAKLKLFIKKISNKEFWKNLFAKIKQGLIALFAAVKKGLIVAYHKTIKAFKIAFKAIKKWTVVAYAETKKALVKAFYATKKGLIIGYNKTKKGLIVAFFATKKFVKENYVGLEMILFGLALFSFASLNVIQIYAVNFFDVFEQNYNIYQVALWLFAGQVQTSVSLGLSLISLSYFLVAITSIVLGLLITFKVIKKYQINLNYLVHVLSFFVLILFTLNYLAWTTNGDLLNLSQLGINTIFYNYYTVTFSTYIYFVITFVIVVFTLMYSFNNRKNLIK